MNNFIVRMPNWIGDIIMALPVLEDIKTNFPNSHLAVLIKQKHLSLLKNNSFIDEYLFLEDKKKLIKNLKKFETGVLLTNSFSSALLFYRARIKKIIGYSKDLRNFFLTESIKYKNEKIHQIDKYKKLLNFLNISNSQSLPILKLKNEDINEAKNLLLNSGYDYKNKLIGINCTAAFGDAKCWPKERYKELITKFLEQNYKVIFFSEKKDDFFSDLSILNFQGNTNLSQLIHLINECSLFISNDSGPMHIASSLKRPLIAIFGSTCDIRTGPYNGYVIKKNVSCSPCFKRKCPIDFRCMKNISVKEVFEKSVEILNV
ncbi:MAG: lipopolysaccharide heptosyltransferase II [Chlamydiae bacterium RIFCSPHIGHO2_12_FULL_27_8]|nr:MAG: lipopolysaccharide heptosyltransferase II [Chlamydiae bacterium RIFCSPHIGHO2_12_FULL_27_8]OGN65065.1 MAG: lipopolysaccharide heptosyltransferase II [Chlamydiae bacterium RIFCSPLOWO2_01_FULL_28_7]